MRRYARSKLRIGLFVLMIAATVFIANIGNAQNTPAAPANNNVKVATAPTSLFQVIMANTDPVFFLIMLCSVIGVTLIIQGFIKNRRSVVIPEPSVNAIREMINQRQFKELIEFTEVDPTFVSRALNPALKRAGQGFNAMKEAMETAIGEQTAEHFRKIEYLNILGNLGPLLGLLGTVLGMIAAFAEMNAAGGSAEPSKLAGGISKALAHTFLGLALAIPCLASFGILRTIVDRLTVQGALIAEELLLMIKPAEAKPAVAATRGGAVAPVTANVGGAPMPAMPVPPPPAGSRRAAGPTPPPAPAV
jgi:biopolymer transport protein ExbB